MAEKNNTRLERMLRFTARCGMGTTSKYDQHCYDDNEDVRKAELAKALRDKLLRSFPLRGNLKYYTIGPNAEKRFSIKASVGAKGYGTSTLPKRVAIFDYCTSVTPLCSRLLLGKSEFAEAFPELTAGLGNLQDQYFFEPDHEGKPKQLVTFVVDAAVKTRTLMTKVRSICNKRQQNYSFRLLMDEGAFKVVVITHCQARQTELTKALNDPEKASPLAVTEVQISTLLAEVIGNA